MRKVYTSIDDLSQQISEGLEVPRRNAMGDLVDGAGNITVNYYGSFVIDGMEIGYHAAQMPDGKIHISTYYLTQPN